MPRPVVEYLTDLHQSLGVGVPETSGYPALKHLLNTIGDTLKPKISAVIHPSNTGAGLPDGGLFSTKELRKHGQESPTLLDMKPERGVIEVKGLGQDITGLEQTPQVRGYLEHYRQILITNYRTFALFSWANGKPVAGERYVIANSEQAFWAKVHTLRNDPKNPEHEREGKRKGVSSRKVTSLGPGPHSRERVRFPRLPVETQAGQVRQDLAADRTAIASCILKE